MIDAPFLKFVRLAKQFLFIIIIISVSNRVVLVGTTFAHHDLQLEVTKVIPIFY